ncbi:hypothetical protein ACLB2K_010623 [Fragaria x ananassa]
MLRGYNAKHPKTWDESLPYLQFAFNRAVHSSSGTSPFETCYGYLPPSPFDMVFTAGDSHHGKGESDKLRAQRFLEKISQIHATVEAQLRKSQAKYKAKHDKHRIGDNAFKLDLPPYLGMYSVINAEYLKLFEPPLLNDNGDNKTVLPSVEDLWFDQEDPLVEDCILERKVTTTRKGERTAFLIGRAGQVPSKAKWFSEENGTLEFPNLQF